MEIVVFNGNSGNTTHITDKEQIQHIIENLNDVEIKRNRLSVGHSGYSFQLTIYLSTAMKQAIGITSLSIRMMRSEEIHFSTLSQKVKLITTI